ncbi:hypothetical protein ZIOFF_050489 [Zingiber officinale]|uniref:Uncharacterized protein n=1 Tax=Zingiber officinale TaxID=94328 RepID=A0A8J5KRD9_ZINOF|nr:hypothetical protein ZIOFF_050489 [Zingiber officinale]
MISFDDGKDNNGIEADFVEGKKDLEPQGVDPIKGWNFRGVHKAIICGKIGQAPIQKILRNGKIATIFTVGTGVDIIMLIISIPVGFCALVLHFSSSVLVEGDIETRVYNDSITGQVKNIPEICVRHDGM